MGAVWLRASPAAGRLWASLPLVLLAGLAGGVVLAALVGPPFRRRPAPLPGGQSHHRRDGLVSRAGRGSRRGPTWPRSYG